MAVQNEHFPPCSSWSFWKFICFSQISIRMDILLISHIFKYNMLLRIAIPQYKPYPLHIDQWRQWILFHLIQFVRIPLVTCSDSIIPLSTAVLFLESNRPTAAKSVASFPPREAPTTNLTVPPPTVSATRTTPTLNDSSSTIDDDTSNVEDDELVAYDEQQASIHGEEIILLRKRIRQVRYSIHGMVRWQGTITFIV